MTWPGHAVRAAPPGDAQTADIVSELISQSVRVTAGRGEDTDVDHKAVARLAGRIAASRTDIALAFYPIWMRLADLTASNDLINASADALAVKACALASHATQMIWLSDDDRAGFVRTAAYQAHWLTPPGIVIATQGHSGPSEPAPCWHDDLWTHRTSDREGSKYAAVLAMIVPGPFCDIFKIGCGKGTLAVRCSRLTAMDCTPTAMQAMLDGPPPGTVRQDARTRQSARSSI